MMNPAPADFWKLVAERLAQLIFEREIQSSGVVPMRRPQADARIAPREESHE